MEYNTIIGDELIEFIKEQNVGDKPIVLVSSDTGELFELYTKEDMTVEYDDRINDRCCHLMMRRIQE